MSTRRRSTNKRKTRSRKFDLRNPKYMKLYWQHEGEPKMPELGNKITIISIDPGVVNYCLRVEHRYNNGKVVTANMSLVEFDRKDHDRYRKLSDFLDSITEYIKACHFVFVEEQMRSNTDVLRMSQHTLTYFMMATRNKYNLPLVYEVNSKLKTNVLAGPPKPGESRKKGWTKKWAISHAKQILNDRDDNEALERIRSSRKKDDLCDVVVQAEAAIMTLQLTKFQSRKVPMLVIVK